jgi:hypothetical protein
VTYIEVLQLGKVLGALCHSRHSGIISIGCDICFQFSRMKCKPFATISLGDQPVQSLDPFFGRRPKVLALVLIEEQS